MERSGGSPNQNHNCFARRIALLGTFSEVTINCLLAPNNVSCLLAVAKRSAKCWGYLLVQLVGNSRGLVTFWMKDGGNVFRDRNEDSKSRTDSPRNLSNALCYMGSRAISQSR